MKRSWAMFKYEVVHAVILVLFAVFVGLTANCQAVYNAFTTEFEDDLQTLTQECSEDLVVGVASVDDVNAVMSGGGVIIDARSQELYNESHVEGAISVPAEKAQDYIASLKYNIPLEQPVVVYCRGEGCLGGDYLGACMKKEGFKDVKVFKGGMSELGSK